MGKDRGHRHSERERMKWNFNGYMPMQSTVNPKPPLPPTSGSNAQKVTGGKMVFWRARCINRNATYKCSVCGKLCSSYYNDVGEWKYCPHCGAKLQKEKTENE